MFKMNAWICFGEWQLQLHQRLEDERYEIYIQLLVHGDEAAKFTSDSGSSASRFATFPITYKI